MKKLSAILSEEPQAVVTSSQDISGQPGQVDIVLSQLSQSTEMLDDIYNTISHFDEIDIETATLVNHIYINLDDVYAKIDQKYDVIPVSLDDYETDDSAEMAFEEVYGEWQLQLDEASTGKVPPALMKLGFRLAPNDQYTGDQKIDALYGIPMRAGKWADTFFAVTSDENKPYVIVAASGEVGYSGFNDAVQSIKKVTKLKEALTSSDPVSVWIDDFVASDAPQFKGKSKKERIKMALGAHYAAQKNESIDESQITDYDKFQKQHKKMYPSHTEAQIKAAFEKYTSHFATKKNESTAIDKNWSRLSATGLVSEQDAIKIFRVIQMVNDGETPSQTQTKILADTAVKLIQIVVGDTSILSKIKTASK